MILADAVHLEEGSCVGGQLNGSHMTPLTAPSPPFAGRRLARGQAFGYEKRRRLEGGQSVSRGLGNIGFSPGLEDIGFTPNSASAAA